MPPQMTPPKAQPAQVVVAPPPETAPAAPPAVEKDEPTSGATKVEAKRTSDSLRLKFPFATPAPAALFRRADSVLVRARLGQPLDLRAIKREGGALIGDVSAIKLDAGRRSASASTVRNWRR